MEYFQVEHRLQRSIGEHKMWRGRQSFELILLFCKQINDINNVTDKMMKHRPPCFFSSSFLSLFFAKYPQIGANVNCRSMWFGNSCARQVMFDYLLGDNKDLTMNVNWMSDPGWIIVFTCPKIKTSIGKSRTNNLKYKSHLLLTILCKKWQSCIRCWGQQVERHFCSLWFPLNEIDTFFSSRFGSDELKRNFLAPAIAGDIVSCLGVRFVIVFMFGVFGFWC